MEKREDWRMPCTHKHCDPSLGQQSAPCPYHDSSGFCIHCSAFVYKEADHEKHYIERFANGPALK